MDVKPRLRLRHFLIQPVLVADDGQTLVDVGPVPPVALTHAQLNAYLSGWPATLEQFQRELDQATTLAPTGQDDGRTVTVMSETGPVAKLAAVPRRPVKRVAKR